MNRGARRAGCLHNTGEGGLSRHHRHGGDLVFQIGTAYFGCRDAARALQPAARSWSSWQRTPVRAIEIKLSQGAKPGVGGHAARREGDAGDRRDPRRPGGRRLREPADPLRLQRRRRAARVRRDASPTPPACPWASSRRSVSTGFWQRAGASDGASRPGVDFITIDGGEGGTGAAPLVFTDHVALPVPARLLARVPALRRAGVARATSSSSAPASSASPTTALLAFALGCGHGQRRPRGDALHRLHPGPALPHRPLPDRHHHPLAVAPARPRPRRRRPARLANYVAGLRRELPRARARLRRPPPGPGHPRPHRAPGRPARHRRPRIASATSPAGRSPRRRTSSRSARSCAPRAGRRWRTPWHWRRPPRRIDAVSSPARGGGRRGRSRWPLRGGPHSRVAPSGASRHPENPRHSRRRHRADRPKRWRRCTARSC